MASQDGAKEITLGLFERAVATLHESGPEPSISAGFGAEVASVVRIARKLTDEAGKKDIDLEFISAAIRQFK